MKKILFISTFLTFLLSKTVAQCTLKPLLLNERVANSSHVIEGKVTDQISFWDPLHQNIYTSNLIEVYKAFKNTSNPYIEVITLGGRVGDRILTAEPSLKLSVGDVGVFTLNPNSLPAQFGNQVYEVYADAQGFIKYNLPENKANEPFKTYSNLSSGFYNDLQEVSGSAYSVIKPNNTFYTPAVLKNTSTAVITDFTPTTITAGTFSVLTINGSGFGTTQGTSFVEFANANNGGATYFQPYQNDYISWSDTQIKVRVPSTSSGVNGCAGTGPIHIDIGGTKTISTATLIIAYSHKNIYLSATPSTIYSFPHVNMTNGGYELAMYTGFNANTPAKAAFNRALENWRCNTHINISSTTTTTLNVDAADYYNVIRFDVGAQLPSGTLARTSIWGTACGTNPTAKTYIDEIDIVFDDGVNWFFGPGLPGPTQTDFETAALHEIGHAHSIWHVIDSLDVMHYAYNDGETKRILNSSNIAAGNAMMAISLSGSICSQQKMIALTANNCSLHTDINELNALTNVQVYPNPGNGFFNVQCNEELHITNICVVNALGQTVYTKDQDISSSVTLDLTELSKGIYYLKANTSKGFMTTKLIKD